MGATGRATLETTLQGLHAVHSIELLFITNHPEMALEAEAAGVDCIFIDLEVNGKAERQPLDTIKSDHSLEDVDRIRRVLRTASLLVRVNPLHDGSRHEIDDAIARGADRLMLPMFRGAVEAEQFLAIVAGRCRVNLLLETPQALARCHSILSLPGIDEVHVGLNDLNLGLGTRFLFEILAGGLVEMVMGVARGYDVSPGFGGVARIGGGELPGDLVIGEHARVGSERVILSRAFHNRASSVAELRAAIDFPSEVQKIRDVYSAARRRTPEEHEANRLALQRTVQRIARDLPGTTAKPFRTATTARV